MRTFNMALCLGLMISGPIAQASIIVPTYSESESVQYVDSQVMKNQYGPIDSTTFGKPFGYAATVTGGGNATPSYPNTIQELVSLLTDSSPRVIILTKTFDFRGTEGRTVE